MEKRPEGYNIKNEIIGDVFISTQAVVTSSPYVGYYYIFETLIFNWDGKKSTSIKHQINHSNEKVANKVHDYIVKNIKEVIK